MMNTHDVAKKRLHHLLAKPKPNSVSQQGSQCGRHFCSDTTWPATSDLASVITRALKKKARALTTILCSKSHQTAMHDSLHTRTLTRHESRSTKWIYASSAPHLLSPLVSLLKPRMEDWHHNSPCPMHAKPPLEEATQTSGPQDIADPGRLWASRIAKKRLHLLLGNPKPKPHPHLASAGSLSWYLSTLDCLFVSLAAQEATLAFLHLSSMCLA